MIRGLLEDHSHKEILTIGIRAYPSRTVNLMTDSEISQKFVLFNWICYFKQIVYE
jgi:hypothetical protein